jgi:hypothetical protein
MSNKDRSSRKLSIAQRMFNRFKRAENEAMWGENRAELREERRYRKAMVGERSGLLHASPGEASRRNPSP